MTAKSSCSCRGALLGLLLFFAANQSRADGWFLRIDNELNWIPIQTAGVLAGRPLNPTNQTLGGPAFDFEIRKALDRASPLLLQKCALSQPLNRVTLAYILTKPQATQYRFTLTNVFVSSFNQGASSDSSEPETIHIRFDKLELAWFDLAPNGGTAGGLTAWLNQPTGEGGLKSRPPFLVTLTQLRGGPGVQVSWPAQAGHRYQILTRSTLDGPWTRLAETTATVDGPMSQVLSNDLPSLFLRVEEID
ncbi:MAG TPA: type VI secretion system tube protein Hcp [Verrucomicrobiae bacterium]|nr:type VI secretion system tube protein Hcp [Verrucomicrobiae bacterium]